MLTFVTGNKNKLAEVRAVLGEVAQLDVDLVEMQELDPHVIIRHKLAEARKQSNAELIVEDASAYFDALDGLPGPLIKWFMQALGPAKIHALLHKLGNTKAHATSVIGYAAPGQEPRFFEGTVRGTVVAPRGKADFGWDPIFVPDGHEQTFAEMGSEEKNKISHRRKALEQLKAYLGASADR